MRAMGKAMEAGGKKRTNQRDPRKWPYPQGQLSPR